jgi:hypothetical protein
MTTGSCTIKLALSQEAREFATVSHFCISAIFVGKGEACQSTLMVLYSNNWLPQKIRLGLKVLTLANTLAYYNTAIFFNYNADHWGLP